MRGVKSMERDPRHGGDAIVVVFAEDAALLRVDVEPGDTIVLPFDSDVPLQMREGSGNLAVRDDRDHDHTIILQGFVEALGDSAHPVVIESRDGTPVDVATVLAMTDPRLDVQACGWAPDPSPFDGGGIYQPFEGGVALADLSAVGCQSASAGLRDLTSPLQPELLQ